MQSEVIFSGNETKLIATSRKPLIAAPYLATLLFSGIFGGASAGLYLSTDGGLTYVPALDDLGDAVVITQAGSYTIQLGWPTEGQQPLEIYGTTTGGTDTYIKVAVYDNAV